MPVLYAVCAEYAMKNGSGKSDGKAGEERKEFCANRRKWKKVVKKIKEKLENPGKAMYNSKCCDIDSVEA